MLIILCSNNQIIIEEFRDDTEENTEQLMKYELSLENRKM